MSESFSRDDRISALKEFLKDQIRDTIEKFLRKQDIGPYMKKLTPEERENESVLIENLTAEAIEREIQHIKQKYKVNDMDSYCDAVDELSVEDIEKMRRGIIIDIFEKRKG